MVIIIKKWLFYEAEVESIHTGAASQPWGSRGSRAISGDGESEGLLDGKLYSWLEMPGKGRPQIGNSNSLLPSLSQSWGDEVSGAKDEAGGRREGRNISGICSEL